MKHASLFSGIGGFDLAAQWMGWENVFQVEIDSFCQKVLAKNFPNVTRYGDIKQFDGTKYTGAIDVLSGGFPCQPFSVAGKRKGKQDDRHLWPEMLRTIREIRPRWIVGENVTGIIGMVLNQVLTEMEGEGYNTETYIIPACAINAPHRRDRVWIIAHCNGKSWNLDKSEKRLQKTNTIGIGSERLTTNPRSDGLKWPKITKEINNQGVRKVLEKRYEPYSLHDDGYATNADKELFGCGHNGTSQVLQDRIKEDERIRHTIPNFNDWLTESPICRKNDGIPNRVDRIKSLGNSVVPQVVFEIFKAIQSVHEATK